MIVGVRGQVPISRLLRKWQLSHSFFRQTRSHFLPPLSARSPVKCLSEGEILASVVGFPHSDKFIRMWVLETNDGFHVHVWKHEVAWKSRVTETHSKRFRASKLTYVSDSAAEAACLWSKYFEFMHFSLTSHRRETKSPSHFRSRLRKGDCCVPFYTDSL
jgi:hypothetical protein